MVSITGLFFTAFSLSCCYAIALSHDFLAYRCCPKKEPDEPAFSSWKAETDKYTV
jgi:hypothetical protein